MLKRLSDWLAKPFLDASDKPDNEPAVANDECAFKAIRDWWTRPSWAEYEAEQLCREHAQSRAVELICERSDLYNRIAAAAGTANEFGVKLGQANAEIVGLYKRIDGLTQLNVTLNRDLEDVADERKNAEYAHTQEVGRLEREIDRLKADHNNLVDTYSNDVVALPFALRKVEELEAEIDRLRKLGIEQVEKSPVHKIEIENGAIEVTTRPPHWAMKAMAASFADSLDGAPNWRSIEIGPIRSDRGMLIVTVCRASGESPVETVSKLKACIEELLSLDGGSVYHPPGGTAQDIFDRARALLNPTKKD